MFNVGKYINITKPYIGIAGNLPLNFWVLDYNKPKAEAFLIPNTELAVQSMEQWLGPYPFYEDGFKIVDAPFIGMEHQSAVAYGNRYKFGYKGRDISGTGWGLKYDIILVHEIAHEWFGNSITTEDLADKWVHEGFTGYAEILYLEQYFGKQAATEYMIAKRKNIENHHPIIPRYNINETGGADDYSKGRAIVHMIRQIINDDETFKQLMKDLNKHFYHKISSSKEVESFICTSTKIDFTKMFDQFLRTIQIPVIEYKVEEDQITYRYINCNADFTMPLKVTINNTSHWLRPTSQWQSLKLKIKSTKPIVQVDENFYVSALQKDN